VGAIRSRPGCRRPHGDPCRNFELIDSDDVAQTAIHIRRTFWLTENCFVDERETEENVMADDRSKRGPQDRSRISLEEDYEVRYWTDALGVSADRLRELVQEHGNSAGAVRKALDKAA